VRDLLASRKSHTLLHRMPSVYTVTVERVFYELSNAPSSYAVALKADLCGQRRPTSNWVD